MAGKYADVAMKYRLMISPSCAEDNIIDVMIFSRGRHTYEMPMMKSLFSWCRHYERWATLRRHLRHFITRERADEDASHYAAITMSMRWAITPHDDDDDITP